MRGAREKVMKWTATFRSEDGAILAERELPRYYAKEYRSLRRVGATLTFEANGDASLLGRIRRLGGDPVADAPDPLIVAAGAAATKALTFPGNRAIQASAAEVKRLSESFRKTAARPNPHTPELSKAMDRFWRAVNREEQKAQAAKEPAATRPRDAGLAGRLARQRSTRRGKRG